MENKKSIAQNFFEVAKLYENNIAVDDPINGPISYKAFSRLVLYFANNFIGFGKNPKILIHLPQGTLAYAAMMGSIVSGATYAPVNVSSPKARIKMIFGQFCPDLVVSSSNFDTLVPTLIPDVTASSTDFMVSETSASSYVIFTSGSTGMPKGVEISRASHSLHVENWIKEHGIMSSDRVSQHPSVSFDLSVSDIYGALTTGATLVPFGRKLDKMFPARSIKSSKISVWNSTPSVINFMESAGELAPSSMPLLRVASFVGEPLTPRQVRVLRKAAPNVEIHNGYGPTEATVAVTHTLITNEEIICSNYTSLPLGDAMVGNRVSLVGLDGQISETEGEIVIAGKQLAVGYWNDLEQTKKSFRTFDIGEGPERTYFTGDWARWIDKRLFFVERMDQQVKVNGHRVELEAVSEAVSDASGFAAIAIQLDQKIYAFVEGCLLTKNEVQELLEETGKILDQYAQPSGIFCIDRFPQNENNKIDVSALKIEALKQIEIASL